ncbi:hypothetical protein F2P81_014468 [Scophthalmus maximus]|uniref:Reverse transcriptase domain-containing protein n=1 Tax=Scophthalmus maximus TaxID=52904 RepID=A0A6A4SJ14_SCOMX|nr:hypothetical protein F2P81_014468 [Scophthalmus maximus]
MASLRLVPQQSATVEQVLLAVGEQTKKLMDKQLSAKRSKQQKDFLKFYDSVIAYIDKWFDFSSENVMMKLKMISLHEDLSFTDLEQVVVALKMTETSSRYKRLFSRCKKVHSDCEHYRYRLRKLLTALKRGLKSAKAEREVKSFSPPEGTEPDDDSAGTHPGVTGVPVSATASLPVIGALVHDLPGIIKRAAAYKNLMVPPTQVPPSPDEMTGGFLTSQTTSQTARCPLWLSGLAEGGAEQAEGSAITNPLLDSLQFTYRANRSVDDALTMALHFTLQHLNFPGTYARILFVDFSSAFNTILPALVQDKLSQLHVPDSTCRWITDFLSDRKQRVKLEKHVSESQTISTGSPKGCVLSPLLFSLYTNGCTSSHQSVKLLKFADDTTLIGLISGGDESAYRARCKSDLPTIQMHT